MRRLERLHALTDHLRARAPRPVSAAALALRFGVSQRTIERDLRSLADAGVPIYGEPGRLGGYSILPEYSLPPLRLTASEATACVAALGLLEGSPLGAAALTALDKLQAALPEAVLAHDIRGIGRPEAVNTAAWLDAVSGRRLVRLVYTDGAPRVVEPYTTLHGGGAWYLVGWCRCATGVRGFRTDRVRELVITGETFPPIHADDVARDLERWDAAPLA